MFIFTFKEVKPGTSKIYGSKHSSPSSIIMPACNEDTSQLLEPLLIIQTSKISKDDALFHNVKGNSISVPGIG